MSILQEYEEIREFIGHDLYDSIDNYLKEVSPQEQYEKYNKELTSTNIPIESFAKRDEELKKKYGIVLLSDVIYNRDEWNKYFTWYHEVHNHRQAKILDIWKTDFDDIRCNALLYENNKLIANVIVGSELMTFEEEKQIGKTDDKQTFKTIIYNNFNKYVHLPKVSRCSKLLQEVYDFVCESEATMCHIDSDDWKEFYADRFNDKDIENLKEEVKLYHLEDVITFDDNNYKILGYGDLEKSFNDDRKINRQKDKDKER